MKTLWSIFALAGALLFSSCTKHYTEEVINPVQTYVTTVKQSQWVNTSDPVYGDGFGVSIPVNIISKNTIANGSVQVYISLDGVNFEPLPEVIGNITYLTSHSEGQLYMEIYFVDGRATQPVFPYTRDILVKVVVQDPA